MAVRKILAQLDIEAITSLITPNSGFIGLGAKSDGLYQKISATEYKLATTADFVNAVMTTATIGDSKYISGKNTDVDAGTEVIVSQTMGTYTAFYFDYVITKGTNARAGTIIAVKNNTSIEFMEYSTSDIGNTSEVNLSVVLNGSNIELKATVVTNDWSVKAIVRMI